jgi:hypothetical protein
MWVWEKMVPKCELLESIPLHAQGPNYIVDICELEDHVGEKGLNSNWPLKFRPIKKNSYKFSQSFVKKCFSWIRVSLCLVASPRRGKVKHHWGSKRNKCQAATLYGSCIILFNGKRNVICTSCYKTMGMQLYNWKRQMPEWKDPKTSNVETHVQANAWGVGVRKGIEPRWSQGFGLDEFDVWQEC